MSDLLATLQPYLELHEADLVDLRESAAMLERELRRRPRPDDSPKPPPDRGALRRELAGLQRSIATHERIMELARDARVAELLQAVVDDSALAREAAADPRAFAARHDVELPDTMRIAMQVGDGTVSARIRNLDDDMPFEITWTQDGFPAPPQPAEIA